jgi:hypothetical protein
MPDNPSFTPVKHSSLRTAVAQMEDLALSQPATPGSHPLSSHHSSSTPSLSGLNDALEEHALKQENGESLVQSPGTRAREGSEASGDGEKGNTFFGATTPLCVRSSGSPPPAALGRLAADSSRLRPILRS